MADFGFQGFPERPEGVDRMTHGCHVKLGGTSADRADQLKSQLLGRPCACACAR